MRPTGASTVLTAALAATVLATVVGTVAAAQNTPPLPDAGLDQSVPAGATVYLDANGSRDPDGTIASVRWTIETPDGTTTTPDCGSCRQTTFSPGEIGQYNVTLRVTDDDGATRSDTLYVDTVPDSNPTVSLSGPTTVAANTSVDHTAQIDSNGSPLSTVAWVVDGRVVDRQSISGESTTATFSHAYGSTGSRSLRAVVYDQAGHRGEATHSVTVGTPVGGAGGGGHDHNCPDGTTYLHADGFGGCQTGSDLLIKRDGGNTVLIDANGKDGIQTTLNGVEVTIDNSVLNLREYRLENGGYDRDMLISDYKKIYEAKRNVVFGDNNEDNKVEKSTTTSNTDTSTQNLYGGVEAGKGTQNMHGGSSGSTSIDNIGNSDTSENDSSNDGTHGMYGGSENSLSASGYMTANHSNY